jgi:hypothetical protein
VTATTTEAELHAALAAGDATAYAPLEDLYLEAGAADAARAVAHLGRYGKWPLRCPMLAKPHPVTWVLGLLGPYGSRRSEWLRAMLEEAAFRGLGAIIRDLKDGSTVVPHQNLSTGRRKRPFRSGPWFYFRDPRQALDHLGRALALRTPTV